ncbi:MULTISPECIES: hypothetical protein [Pseudomonas]|jgi:hypothetical protein|uniref:Uncharacterized protein n=1 Tax=Pseudomonas rhodesiae TaxID=76760 RepID=A0A8I1JI79_9PSED|nr:MULTISPECIES: hypothetical protein [Pseudomonas]MBI6605144.1 hypothetical protein [Pseudomonas sp. S4_EA_1b]MBI6628190.1 hypothetical protein [Pseudomonas rhodesiae]QVN09542.1 hypothetical protein JYG35_12980 [Pseudomonas rhodesiae]
MPVEIDNTEIDDEIEEEEEYEEEGPEELDPMDQEGWEHNIERLNDL